VIRVSFITGGPVHAAASCEHHSGSKLPSVHGRWHVPKNRLVPPAVLRSRSPPSEFNPENEKMTSVSAYPPQY
jgi:hypothetical protein